MMTATQLVTTYLLDGRYQGFVNSSYQRNGFGLLLTSEYDFFAGFFRYLSHYVTDLISLMDRVWSFLGMARLFMGILRKEY